MVEIEREDGVREGRVHEHDVADDEGGTFMSAQNAGRERPSSAEVRDIGCVDLFQDRVACSAVVAVLNGPVLGIVGCFEKVITRQGRGHRAQQGYCREK